MEAISLRRLLSICEPWAKDGIRTRDPNLGKVMLYQLSYFRIAVAKIMILGNKANLPIIFCSQAGFYREIMFAT